jgi:hypothetical protein
VYDNVRFIAYWSAYGPPPRPSSGGTKKILSPDEIRNGIARREKRVEELTTFDPQKMTQGYATRDWKIRILSTALAVMLWLVWFYATIHASRSPKKNSN